MATAAELLAEDGAVSKTLVISNDLRTIAIPSTVPCLGVEYDDEVLRLEFMMPRYLGDTDLSEFAVRINYINARGQSDIYTVHDVVVEDDHLTFSWLVGPIATRYRGRTSFNICLRTFTSDGNVDREFNTTIASLPVLEGLEVEIGVTEQVMDMLEQWKQELLAISLTEQEKIAKAAKDAIESFPEIPETTYISVDEVLAAMPTVTAINLSNFESGSFTEKVDGVDKTYTVTFDDEGRPITIGDIAITWEA